MVAAGTRIVEFIGPSAVGKSTLCRELMRRRDPADGLSTYDEAVRHHNGLIHGTDTSHCERYERLLELQKVWLQKYCEGSVSERALAYFRKVVAREVQLEKIDEQETFIILEEGMVHNFYDVLLDLRAVDPEAFGLLVRNRAVINCAASSSIIVSRIRQREAQGHLMMLHKDKSDEELAALCSEELDSKAELMRKLREYGVPCLDLDMESDVPSNLQKVQSFLQKISRRPVTEQAERNSGSHSATDATPESW